MIWIFLAPLTLALLAGIGVTVLLYPPRPFSLAALTNSEWTGRVPYRVAHAGTEEVLVVRDLPYPGSFASSSTRRAVSLDGSWRFRLDPDTSGEAEGWWRPNGALDTWDEAWVPGTFNSAESSLTDYLGVVWYRRSIGREELPPRNGGYLRLRFAGLLLRGKVWWNGRFVGEYEGGYTPSYFALPEPETEENHLVVSCDNRLTPDSLPPKLKRNHNPGWHTYGGIHRCVTLELLPADSVLTLRTMQMAETLRCTVVTQHSAGRACDDRLRVYLRIGPEDEQPSAEVVALRGGSNVREGLTTWIADLPTARLSNWSPDSPRRYAVTITLSHGSTVVDEVTQTGGLRSVRVDGESILLNGKPVFLKGICRHEDHPVLGATQTAHSIEDDLSLVDGLHANYLRLTHYPHDEAEIEAAERRGLLLSEEIPLYQAGTGFAAWKQEGESPFRLPVRLFGLRQIRRRELLAHARRQLLEMIERDRNRPSLLFWGVGNECYTHGNRAGATFAGLARIARRADPSRPVTYVELTYNIPFFDDRRRGWEGADILSLNSYFGWYYGEADEISPHLERFHRTWGGRPLILSEFGAGAAPGRMSGDGLWRGERVQRDRTYSEDYQTKVIERYWQEARQNPWVVGVSPWVFADFYNVWFPTNPVPNFNLKGILSADRRPKLAYRALARRYAEYADEESFGG